MSSYCTNSIQFFSLIIFILIAAAASQSVETLPGYSGALPFNLETGYISVGEDEEMQMFYYFIESESDPQRDPLMFWLTGGPGCSGFSGLVYEIGPLRFDVENFDGSLPNFTINPYSWTKLASIIFIDSPVGTGFSYSTKPETYASTDDTTSAFYNYIFLKKWLSSHPTFLKNRLYIAGDSYAGKIVPMVALLIAEGNEAGDEPRLPLQGYIVGNSRTDAEEDDNQIIPYAHRMALVSDEYFEFWRSSCDGKYENPDPKNFQCAYALHLVEECTDLVNGGNILEPRCKFISPSPPSNGFRWSRLLLLDDPLHILLPSSTRKLSWCRNDNYVSSYIWANDESVQEALHVRKGTKSVWRRCNKTLAYDEDVKSVLKHHLLLSEKGYQALAYSGDHDLVIPYMCTLKWIRELNLTLDKAWRPWTVDSQVAGYTETYKNNQAYLMFATIKGAGHTAPEYNPKECFAMIQRWLSLYPL